MCGLAILASIRFVHEWYMYIVASFKMVNGTKVVTYKCTCGWHRHFVMATVVSLACCY